MDTASLTKLVDTRLTQARASTSGRSASTVFAGQRLRQTLMALAAGQELAEHDSPGEATLQVLHGQVRLATAESAVEGTAGDLLVIPPARHRLEALADSAVLLTVVID